MLAGGICAAVIGPQLVIFTKDVWPPYLFAGTFLAQSACAVLAAAVLTVLRCRRARRRRTSPTGGRSIEIVREPRFIVAVACGVASFALMNLMMTAAPLAMVMCNHSVGEAALGIQWHVIGMYAPSFFTGTLIARFGLRAMIAIGLLLIVAAASIGLLGIGAVEFLDRAGAPRRRLEFRLHRRHHAGHRVSRPARTQQGAGVQRLSGIRLDRDRLALVRRAAVALRLDGGQRCGVSGRHCRRRAACMGHARAPASDGVKATA